MGKIIKWGRATGRVKVALSIRGCQTDGLAFKVKETQTSTRKENVPVETMTAPCAIVNSPDRSRFNFFGVITTRCTRAGGLLLEVEGQEGADHLADKIRAVVEDAARVRTPQGTTTVLILDVPEWATNEEVIDGLKKVGIDCERLKRDDNKNVISITTNISGRGKYVARVNLL